MVVEHVFVTTQEPAQAMRAAADLLYSHGFRFDRDSFSGPPDAPTAMEALRGKTNAQRAYGITELPQRVRLEYDRGRMSIAASIVPKRTWNGRHASFSSAANASGTQPLQQHAALLVAMAQGLENLLAFDQSPNDAAEQWTRIENRLSASARS